jgi:hypothetical protein
LDDPDARPVGVFEEGEEAGLEGVVGGEEAEVVEEGVDEGGEGGVGIRAGSMVGVGVGVVVRVGS